MNQGQQAGGQRWDYNDSPNKAAREGNQMTAALGALDDAVQQIQAKVRTLDQRLEDVLLQVPPPPPGTIGTDRGEVRAQGSPAVEMLYKLTDRAHEIAQHVDSLVQRYR